MKTLLTLILFLIWQVGIGQEIGYIIKNNGDTVWGFLYKQPKDTFVQKSKYLWRNEATWTYIDSSTYYYQMKHLVNTWEAYQQECWNDSVCYMPYITGKLDSIYVGEIADSTESILFQYENGWKYFYRIVEHCDKYSHREPTFEGFMEYLERRMR